MWGIRHSPTAGCLQAGTLRLGVIRFASTPETSQAVLPWSRETFALPSVCAAWLWSFAPAQYTFHIRGNRQHVLQIWPVPQVTESVQGSRLQVPQLLCK